MKPSSEDIGRVLFAVSGNVNFREIQVELCLAPVHAHGGVAKLFRLCPFLLCRRDGNTHIRNIEGIFRFLIEGGPEMGQSLARIASAQEREAGAEFLERFDLDHVEYLRKMSEKVQPTFRAAESHV